MKRNYDLIVVGTGFSASFFLREYVRKNGLNKTVLVLEKGKVNSHTSRVEAMRENPGSNSINWEQSASSIKNMNPGKPWVFDPNFGGSSNCWTGCTPRFLPNDFKLKSTYGIGEDWPLGYDELEPYYCEIEDFMQIAGPAEAPFFKSKPYPLPPHPISKFDELLQKKFGHLYISQPTARPTQSVNGRPKCCSSVVCNLCPINSKFTVMNSFDALYKSPGVEVITNASVTNLLVEGGQVKGLSYKQGEQEFEVYAETIALGANPIFNAHILLQSGDTNYYTGRGLTEQAGTYAFLYLDGVENIGGGSIIPANGYMLYDTPSRAQYSGCLIESHNTTFIRSENGKWRQIAKLKFIFENLPEDHNRITLSDNMMIPQVEFKGHSEYATKGLEMLPGSVKNLFADLPIEDIYFDGFFQQTEFHICSTTRMSEDPSKGVVDKNLIHHQYRNVFVLGSGCFPTISPANPTLTLSALAVRAVDKTF